MITVAKIRNSSQNNVYGGGKEQIFTDNSGKEYIIKNSSLDNAYGSGKEKVVVESGSSGDSLLAELLIKIMPEWLQTVIGAIALLFPVAFVIYVIIHIFV